MYSVSIRRTLELNEHTLRMAPSRLQRNVVSRYSKHPKDPKEQFKRRGSDLIRKVSDKDRYGIFLDPVDTTIVGGYTDVIARPMDLSTLGRNLQLGVYSTPAELYSDLELIWSNCCTFNESSTIFFREAVRLRALSARFYDDLLLLLERDGVAEALGISNQAHSQSTSVIRPALKRPPRYPPTQPRSNLNAAGTLSASNAPGDGSGALGAELDASGVPLSSGGLTSASGATVQRSQLQQAQMNRDAALETMQLAKAEVEHAAQKAGIPIDDESRNHEGDNGTMQPAQLYQGPSGILGDHRDGRPIIENPEKYPFMNNEHMKLQCSQIPLAWRRVGRWHPPGSTFTPTLSVERARDVHYGRKFEAYVRKSAPVARRLLASVLDPNVVEAHDEKLLAKASLSYENSCTADTNGKSGHANGTCNDNANITDPGVEPRVQSVGCSGSRKRPRSKANERGNGKTDAIREDSEMGRFLTEVVGIERVRKAARANEPVPGFLDTTPSKQSLSRMRSLLKSKGIDGSFVSELFIDEDSKGAQDGAAVNGNDVEGNDRLANEELRRLLNANYEAMLNGLRLRALRDSVNEAEREEVEDRERECAETAAKGVALAVRQLLPRCVVHPVDVAECAKALCGSMLASTRTNKS